MAAENNINGIQLNLPKDRAEASPIAAIPTARDQLELIKWKRRQSKITGITGHE